MNGKQKTLVALGILFFACVVIWAVRTVPEAPKVGRYGMLRRRFLRENRNGTYTAMLLTGKLNQHLKEIDRQANEMMETLTAQMAKQEGVNESLKAENQMKWVGLMNNIQAAAEEIVLKELVYR